MDQKNSRKRNSKNSKMEDIKVNPPKVPKKEQNLESMTKAELVKRCVASDNNLKDLIEINENLIKKIEDMEKKLSELHQTSKSKFTNDTIFTQTYPQNDVDFNCGVCIFQTSMEECLFHHMEIEHDVSINRKPEYEKCSVCLQIFSDKSEMMYHLKLMHEEMVLPCKYFIQGTCMFSDDTCWNSHKENQARNITQLSEFKCKYCESIFKSKNDLMKHRKKEHLSKTALCRYNSKNECKHGDLCWFNHETNTKSIDKNEKTREALSHFENRIMVEENFTKIMQQL